MIQEHRQEKVQAMASELKQSAKIIDEEPETASAEA
jgi:hypothetical protein